MQRKATTVPDSARGILFSGKLKPSCFSSAWRKWKPWGKSERRSSKEEASRELPPEIIREILIRLPIKSIGRSRCVSKLFRSISSDPKFAKSHLDLTVHPRKNLIVSSDYDHIYALNLDLNEVTRDLMIAVDLNYPLKELLYRKNCVEIYGSCNGLVCISPDEGVVYLYNPTTGESKLLPNTSYQGLRSYGFGFDHLNNDYKVVRLVAGFTHLLYATVYSLKSDSSWRRIRVLNNYKHNGCFRPGLNLNGVIHWVFFIQESNRKRKVILAFDVITEEFREMRFPDEVEYCEHSFVVGNLNERLCVFNRCDKLRDYIWVMNDELGSWSRVRISLLHRLLKPVCSTENGEEVLVKLEGGDMVLYNFETDAWRKLEIQEVNCKGCDVNTYVERASYRLTYRIGLGHN